MRVIAANIDFNLTNRFGLTANSVGQALRAFAPASVHVYVSGGGAHNAALMRSLARLLPNARIDTSDSLGVQGDAKEAIAFAVLGYEALRGRAAGLPAVTGARHPAVLGAIAPARLDELIAKIEAEIARSARR